MIELSFLGMAMSVDMWTEDHSKRKFLGMCFYYIKESSLECRVLCCREVNILYVNRTFVVIWDSVVI